METPTLKLGLTLVFVFIHLRGEINSIAYCHTDIMMYNLFALSISKSNTYVPLQYHNLFKNL